MVNVSGIDAYRDGGTIVFQLTGGRVDGLYRLRTPLAGFPRPLSRDDVWLPLGDAVEVMILSELQQWLSIVGIGNAATALAELDQLSLWQNLPERLSRAVPLWRIRKVVEELSKRVSTEPDVAAEQSLTTCPLPVRE